MRTRSVVEVRWLCAGPVPAPVTAWFDSLPGRSRVGRRVDAYWMGAPLTGPISGPCVKLRGVIDRRGRSARRRLHLEMKVMERVGGPVGAPGIEGRAEVWCKAAARLVLPADEDALLRAPGPQGTGWVSVAKQRRRRRVESVEGTTARLELTDLAVARRPAWSVALHAAVPGPGPPPADHAPATTSGRPLGDASRAALAAVVGGPAFADWPGFLPLDTAVCRSYDEWLRGEAVPGGDRRRPPPAWLVDAVTRLAEACRPEAPE